MRARLIMAIAAAALGFGLSQPAAAGGWDDGYCCAGTVYIHHHVYAPVAIGTSITCTRPGRATSTWSTTPMRRLLRPRRTPTARGITSPRVSLALARPALVSAAARSPISR